ncbi:hypothetical protein VTJ83DRAFT_422 [Remersonia thermophila]|uniref:Uncharacterized protein n=1 Tax=Remersonia thermophila TaxID=72144 RepID=A0ABR4DKY2_9PEZI
MSIALAFLGRRLGNHHHRLLPPSVLSSSSSALSLSLRSGTLGRPSLSPLTGLSACLAGRSLSIVAARMASTASLPRLPVFEAISRHDPDSTAVVHSASGRRFRYGDLLADVCSVRNRLCERAGRSDLDGERIAFLVENSYDYVVTWLAVLAAKAIAVPLSPAFPAPELQYILNHSQALMLLSSDRFAPKADEVLRTELEVEPIHVRLDKFEGSGCAARPGAPEKVTLEETGPGSAGMMLYTSGTTNRPKGVLLPESVLTAQARSLLQAWEYSSSDHLLHVLPLHHIHGTINAIYTPLFSGSAIEFMFPFNADAVWRRFAAPFLAAENGHGHANGTGTANGTANGHPIPDLAATASRPRPRPRPITFFTAVPTIYSRLLASHKTLSPAVQHAARTALSPSNLRLAISGSAALPTPVQRAWVELSGAAPLLERYGMTEVGMALSCGLDPADRVDGSVGWPLPGVEARLVDLDTRRVLDPNDPADRDRPGEIQLRGPSIFPGYWRNPEATAREFVLDDSVAANGEGRKNGNAAANGASATNGALKNAWFRTGDVAVRRAPPPSAGLSDRPSQRSWARGDMYFVLGRRSADIIKSGGEKVSALEVERELLALPNVAEAAVVAVPSGRWGQKVGAVVVLNPPPEEKGEKARWSPLEMRRALKGRLAAYKIPQVLRVVDKIPRNAMGKVNKKELVKEVFAEEFSGDEL